MTLSTSFFKRTLAAAAGFMVAALAVGCEQTPKCSELGKCGGDVKGEWALGNGHGSCVEDLYQQPVDTRLLKGDQPAARTVPAELASFDWCDLLVTNGGDVVQTHEPAFSYEPGSIGAAWARYDGGGNYAAGFTRTGTYTVEFPPKCMTDFGAHTKPDANGTPVDVCTQLQLSIKPSSAHKNLVCIPGSVAGACVCRFDVSQTVAGSGKYWFKDGRTVVHSQNLKLPELSAKVDFPWTATFCNKGGTLELTGANGAYLFNEPGLRTLDLVSAPINCSDGAIGPGEDGVDCGPGCPTPSACGAAAPAM
jgi:hypothetical protein